MKDFFFQYIFTRRSAQLTLAFSFLLSLYFAWASYSRMEFTADFTRFYPEEDEEIAFYNEFTHFFLDSNELVQYILPLEDRSLDARLIKDLDDLGQDLKGLPMITGVLSPTQMRYLIHDPLTGFIPLPYFHPDDPDLFEDDLKRYRSLTEGQPNLISDDGKFVLLHVFTRHDLKPEEVEVLGEQILEIQRRYGFEKSYFGGRLFGQNDLLALLKREMALFTGISVLCVIIVLTILMPSWIYVVGPMILMFMAMLWTLAVHLIMGGKIDVLSAMVPTILFVIATSDVIHIYQRYADFIREGVDRKEALWSAFQQVGRATLITSLTTMAGFAALITSNIAPIRDFGLFVSIGVAVAYILTYSYFPAFLLLAPEASVKAKRPPKFVGNGLLGIYRFQERNGKWILVSSVLIIALGLFGLSRLRIDNYLTEEFPREGEFAELTDLIREKFSGFRTVDIGAVIKNEDVLDYETMSQLDTLERFISSTYESGSIFGLGKSVRIMNAAMLGNPRAEIFPDKKNYRSIQRQLHRLERTGELKPILNLEERIVRISGLMVDLGGFETLERNKAIMHFAQEACPDLEVRITGLAHLVDRNNRKTSQNLLYSLSLAFIVVSLIMALLFRTVKLIAISLVPNLLPLATLLFLMYAFGMHLGVSMLLIFTIVFGITVDDTIHFIGKLKVEFDRGTKTQEALIKAFRTTGRSMVLTSIILMVGFLPLTFSSFNSTYKMGIFVSLTILLALLYDLLVLPVLINLFRRNKKEGISILGDELT